jgi:superfamily II DNA helicase RecQ
VEIKLFTIPILGGEKLVSEMNTFLRSQKILQVEKELVSTAQGGHWCFCISYIEGKAAVGVPKSRRDKPDYKKLLGDQAFQKFTLLRKIRKALADDEGVPAYAVFTDAELAEIAKLGDKATLGQLRKVPGIGKKKLEKYGKHFIANDEAGE